MENLYEYLTNVKVRSKYDEYRPTFKLSSRSNFNIAMSYSIAGDHNYYVIILIRATYLENMKDDMQKLKISRAPGRPSLWDTAEYTISKINDTAEDPRSQWLQITFKDENYTHFAHRCFAMYWHTTPNLRIKDDLVAHFQPTNTHPQVNFIDSIMYIKDASFKQLLDFVDHIREECGYDTSNIELED